ncbi:hypothetical protein AAFF_G00334880 [Aldrovandia affinis]|uniref:Uncharacterized protein n=1 Tax=Aldrovandia affinis TaxID=143900 RepID=A0AAD7WPW0_9TELE|nr:hypothetical protein AAFF_G00334880 [Aldrovandia affinis]
MWFLCTCTSFIRGRGSRRLILTGCAKVSRIRASGYSGGSLVVQRDLSLFPSSPARTPPPFHPGPGEGGSS